MRKALPVICAMVMSSASYAEPVLENDQGNTIDAAQAFVVSSDQTVISGNIDGGAVRDIDFYKFYAKAGDVLDISVNGMGGNTPVNTVAAVFGPEPEYVVQRQDTQDQNPSIQGFTVPTTGNYVLAVVATYAVFGYGGDVLTDTDYPSMFSFLPPNPDTVGDYEITISGLAPTVVEQATVEPAVVEQTVVEPAVVESSAVEQTVVEPSAINVSIAIKPGSGDAAPINTKSKGKIPVAILSSPFFKAQSVDTKSLTFGATGDENSLVKCDWTDEDVNGDWLMDKVCHFDTQKANFSQGVDEGTLKGKTLDGLDFIGVAAVLIKH